MDRSGTNVLAFVCNCLMKMEDKGAYIRPEEWYYLDALSDTSLHSGERARFSTQMGVDTASGATGNCERQAQS
jgi:hypothetical protein